MISSAPSAVSRRPLKARRRALTGSLSTVLPARSKRSCTALATLLTFWPPGPEARTKESVISASGMASPGASSSGTGEAKPSVGGLIARRRRRWPDRECAGRRARLARGVQARFELRHRDANAVGAEDAPDRAIHVRADVVDSVHRVGDPKADLEPHAVVLEADQPRDRRRIAQ